MKARWASARLTDAFGAAFHLEITFRAKEHSASLASTIEPARPIALQYFEHTEMNAVE